MLADDIAVAVYAGVRRMQSRGKGSWTNSRSHILLDGRIRNKVMSGWMCRAVAVGSVLVGLGAANIASVNITAYVFDGYEALERTAAAAALDLAMKEDGMALIVGHGMSLDLIAEMEAEMVKLFAYDLETKRTFGNPKVYGPEGYTEMGVEAVSRSNDQGVGKAKADAVESFTFSRRPPASPVEEPDRLALRGLEPSFCAAAQRYWDEMTRVLDVLHNMTADILGVDRDFFPTFFQGESGTVIRLARYPEYDLTFDEDVLRYGTHTDYLTFTLLRATEPGLQLQKRDGTFVNVSPTSDSIVVNAGDLSEVWSNGRWRSAPHRVVPVSKPDDPRISRERYAIAFFTGPGHSKFIAPIVQPGENSNYDGVTAGEWLRFKLDPTSVDREDTVQHCSNDCSN